MTTVPLPETTNHVEAVRALLADVRAVRDRIGGFVHDRRKERSRLNLNAAVSDQFFEACATAIEASPPLAAAAQVQSAELRDIISFSQAYTSLAAELELTARGLRYTIAQRRAATAQLALQAYALAKGLNRPSDRAVLVPHIDSMRRGLKRKRKSQPAEPPLPEPVIPPDPFEPPPSGVAS